MKEGKKVTEDLKAWVLKVLQVHEDYQVNILYTRRGVKINILLLGPPGEDGIGLPGRPGDRGEPGRQGIFEE